MWRRLEVALDVPSRDALESGFSVSDRLRRKGGCSNRPVGLTLVSSTTRRALMASASEKLPDNDTYYMGIALAVRAKANCTGNRIGAVAVLHNRVISTGYNGVPE